VFLNKGLVVYLYILLFSMCFPYSCCSNDLAFKDLFKRLMVYKCYIDGLSIQKKAKHLEEIYPKGCDNWATIVYNYDPEIQMFILEEKNRFQEIRNAFKK
jgi:hypothetical protein